MAVISERKAYRTMRNNNNTRTFEAWAAAADADAMTRPTVRLAGVVTTVSVHNWYTFGVRS